MAQQPIILQLPDDLYERVRQIAEESKRPVENILLDSLELLFGNLPDDEALSPSVLGALTDEELWAIVHRPLAWPQDAYLRELTALGKQGDLSAEQRAELERLVNQVDRYVLLRSQVLLLLKQRGHDVERHLKLGA
jgi:hypothetical protein